ncbi:MAG: N-acetyl-gamma-glutamyl-phosphate reductase [Candidatus Aenigmarchaeota archaeon]|nr:N-acetyl-gamma-glutamyl-phosphate reductase [Candidatus Aenigmarchaeota archaeon]
MIKIGIVGGSGYVAYNLINILSKHNHSEIKTVASTSLEGKKISDQYKDINLNLSFSKISIEELNKMNVVFLAVPHGKAEQITSKITCKIIDISADHRLTQTYGIPEIFHDKIEHSRIVANPGCYATACILSVYPLIEIAENIVFNCISGYSGGGKKAGAKYSHEENIIAYKLNSHFHIPEMKKILGGNIAFTPHVVNTFRGIMCTTHLKLKTNIDVKEIKQKYRDFYNNTFTKVIENKIPCTKDVSHTPYCHIGGFEKDNNNIVIISVIDNLMKGAASQAIENMNIMFGLNHKEGLE